MVLGNSLYVVSAKIEHAGLYLCTGYTEEYNYYLARGEVIILCE